MNKKEIIKQLEGLKSHRQDYAKTEDDKSIWRGDVEALDYALILLMMEIESEGE